MHIFTMTIKSVFCPEGFSANCRQVFLGSKPCIGSSGGAEMADLLTYFATVFRTVVYVHS